MPLILRSIGIQQYSRRLVNDPSLAWRGFSLRKFCPQIQVVAYAVEQVGKGTPEQDEIAALLATIDPSEWQTIDRYLEELAQTENHDWIQALRSGRRAELKHLIKFYRDEDETSGNLEEDEMFSFLYVFLDFWRDYDELPGSQYHSLPGGSH